MVGTALPRLVESSLAARLQVMPAVVVTGARQSGKSTLVQERMPGSRRHFTLDDLDVIDMVGRDPAALVRGDQPMAFDEVQRAPELLHEIKRAIDHNRKPGQFLLTGSANLLLMSQVSESLAGRASYLTLWPMTRREQMGLGHCGVWEDLLTAPSGEWLDLVASQPDAREDWRVLSLRGGFPQPAVHLKTAEERSIWFDGYVRTYLERDLRDLSAISSLADFRRLMRAACHRLGQILNQVDLGRDVALSQSTAHRYLNLLETSYLMVRLPAFAVNRTKRLVKSPKLYWGDTGVALHLAQNSQPEGAHLENLVLCDLLAWRDARTQPADVFYWRTRTGEEVDLVVEAGDRLLPIEIKAADRPRLVDTKHLRAFRSEYGDAATPGLLLHAGSTLEWLTPDVLAAPWWKVM
ncbi:ATP-binding protein [Candidatus Poriferisocius sp.]|uniref:ATP-binding protein n=1 Tax=Candidatus Poriferisocius sp. TaxID=3101276 RepID=UPI003B59865A